MKKLKLAYIGNGPISNFHIPALREANFEIRIFYYRKISKTAERFISNNKINNTTSDLNFFYKIAKSDCDAMVICVKTEKVILYLNKFSNFQKPVLVEKPGAISYDNLVKIKKYKISKYIIFAYNRRYYENILYVKNLLKKFDSSNVLIKIPDSITTFHQFIINGCHVIDLILFLFGDLKVTSKIGNFLKKNNGFQFNAKAKKNIFSFVVNWGAPDNFVIDISSQKKRIVISPLEFTKEYESMEIIQPTISYPLRRYIPKLSKELSIKNLKYKPGFLSQYQSFHKYITKKKISENECDFYQGLKVLKLIEDIKKLN